MYNTLMVAEIAAVSTISNIAMDMLEESRGKLSRYSDIGSVSYLRASGEGVSGKVSYMRRLCNDLAIDDAGDISPEFNMLLDAYSGHTARLVKHCGLPILQTSAGCLSV